MATNSAAGSRSPMMGAMTLISDRSFLSIKVRKLLAATPFRYDMVVFRAYVSWERERWKSAISWMTPTSTIRLHMSRSSLIAHCALAGIDRLLLLVDARCARIRD